MSLFRTNVIAVNPKQEDRVSEAVEAVVDTGSELTWLLGDVLRAIEIAPRRKRSFVTADGTRRTRDVGYAVLRVETYETIDEVVFGEKGDLILLGVRTLEGFGVRVDNIGHRLVATTTLACGTPGA